MWRRGSIKTPSEFFSLSYLDKEILHIFKEQEDEDKSEALQEVLDASKDAKEPMMPVIQMLFRITGKLS